MTSAETELETEDGVTGARSAITTVAALLILSGGCTITLDPDLPVMDIVTIDVAPAVGDTASAETSDGEALSDTQFPDTRVPDTRVPDTRVPDTRVPDTRVPDITAPDAVRVDIGSLTDADSLPEDAVTIDVPPLPDLPESRYCPWDFATLPRTTRSVVFLGEDFTYATDDPSPIDRACDDGQFPLRDQPERVFMLQTDEETTLVVRTRCHDWDCDALVVHGDCLTSNVVACLTTDGDERYTTIIDPGYHLVIVEPRGGFAPGPFDLQLALNHRGGREPCPVEGELRVSELAAYADCVVDDDGQAWREVILSGDTRRPEVRDEVDVGCSEPGVAVDRVGGAPDMIWRVVADTPDGLARNINAIVTPSPDGPSWTPVLAMTGSPCGAEAAVIDCDSAPGGSAVVSDVTVFDDEEIYVVVDGFGEDALDGGASGAFTLTLHISDPSCPSAE